MEQSELTDYIVYQLGRHISRNDIIFDLCQKTGMPWDQSSALLSQVEEQHQGGIVLRQSPIYVIIALGVYLVGLYLACGGALYFLDLIMDGTFAIDPFALRRDYIMILRVGTGLAMVAGSLFGFYTLAKKLFRKSI